MKGILKLCFLVVFVNSFAQTTVPPSGITSTENYVYSRTYLEAVTASSTSAKQVESVTYIDGLGRPKQSIAIKATATGKDVATPILYDPFGRQTQSYLPVPQSGTQSGGIYADPLTNASASYGSEKIYSEKILEASPLDRINQQIDPGTSWQSRPINFTYEANSATDVIKFTTTTTWSNGATSSTLVNSGLYPEASLYKNTVTDEDGNISIELKNGEGQTLLVRKNDGSNPIDTYYVYNEFNQLAVVISPLAADAIKVNPNIDLSSTGNILTQLCYQYHYDSKNRLVEKKLPGKGWEYIVYDQQDRLIMTQDANLKLQNQWLFTKYDQFGRVVYTGLTANSNSRNNIQVNSIEQVTQPTLRMNNESRSTTLINNNGLDFYYTNNAFPTTITTLLSVNYYDTYPTGTPTFDNILGQTSPQLLGSTYTSDGRSTKSLPLASFVKDIEDDDWTKNFSFYDTKARAFATYSFNHLGGSTKTESELDFAGIPQKTYTFQKRLSSDTEIQIKERFEYNTFNNVLEKHYHQVNTQPEELLTDNKFNELGQLTYKNVGNVLGSPLQKVDYQYNIRGWMTGINSPKTLGTDLFGYIISYNILDADFSGGNAKFNGNISQTIWKTDYTGSDAVLRNYFYTYDGLNRLLDASYSAKSQTEGDFNFYDENLTYDINGNIKTLQRFTKPPAGSTALEIDNLVYNYENGDLSNKLSKITLPVGKLNNPSGYDALQNIIGYDSNGNMTSMLDKKISTIEYNYLNLPIKITGTDGKSTTTSYRADGVKLKKTYSLSPTSNKTTDYLDGFQYEDGVMQFVPTSEGYFDFVKNAYIYNYTDHLGNVRVSYYKNSAGVLTVLEESNYYPFGLKHEGYNQINLTTPTYNYKYQGQELQETGWYSFKWRNYDPTIGRFFNIDPLAEKYEDYTPYQFSSNQPVHGREIEGLENANDLNKNTSAALRAVSEKQVQSYAAAAKKNFSNVFNGTVSLKPKFGALGGEIGVKIGPLKGHVGAAVAKIEGSINTQKPSVKIRADGLSVEGSLGVKNAKMEGSIAGISLEGEGTIKSGRPSVSGNVEVGKVEGKMTSGNTSMTLSDLTIGGEVKVYKALNVGVEINVGEAIEGVKNTAGMIGTFLQNYVQEKMNDVKEKMNTK